MRQQLSSAMPQTDPPPNPVASRPSLVERVAGWSMRYRKTVVIDTWTYDFGPNSFVRTLTFENGVLTNVEVGGYGR